MNHNDVISLPTAGSGVTAGDFVYLDTDGKCARLTGSIVKERAIGVALHDQKPDVDASNNAVDVHLLSSSGVALVNYPLQVAPGTEIFVNDGNPAGTTSGRHIGISLESKVSGSGLLRIILVSSDAYSAGAAPNLLGQAIGEAIARSTASARLDTPPLGQTNTQGNFSGESTSEASFYSTTATQTIFQSGSATSSGSFFASGATQPVIFNATSESKGSLIITASSVSANKFLLGGSESSSSFTVTIAPWTPSTNGGSISSGQFTGSVAPWTPATHGGSTSNGQFAGSVAPWTPSTNGGSTSSGQFTGSVVTPSMAGHAIGQASAEVTAGGVLTSPSAMGGYAEGESTTEATASASTSIAGLSGEAVGTSTTEASASAATSTAGVNGEAIGESTTETTASASTSTAGVNGEAIGESTTETTASASTSSVGLTGEAIGESSTEGTAGGTVSTTSAPISGEAIGEASTEGAATGNIAQPSNESLVAAMSGKEIWLDASVFDGSDASNNPSDLTEVGDGTYDWTDRTGNYTLSQEFPTLSDQPYYRNTFSDFNGKGAVHFPAGDRPLYLSSGMTSGFKHLFVVHNAPWTSEAGNTNSATTYLTPYGHSRTHRNDSGSIHLINKANVTDASAFRYKYGSNYGNHYFDDATKDGVAVPDADQATYVASSRTSANEPIGRYNLTNNYTYPSGLVDGSKPVIWEHKFTSSTDQAFRHFNKGETNSSDPGFMCHWGEFIAFTDVLSDADRLIVLKYLSDKYGIPIYTGETEITQESNLTNWYKFEEGTAGQTNKYIRDWAGTKPTFVRNGATIEAGRRGGCVRMADGSNDEVSWTAQTLTIASSYTFSFWAKRDSSGGGSAVTIVASSSTGIEVELDGSNTIFKHDSTSISSTTVPTQGTWAHYAITYDGTTMEAFIDGTSVGSTSLSSPSTSGYLRIGRGIASVNAFIGDVDDVRLYSTNLSSSEIQAVANDDADNPYYNI